MQADLSCQFSLSRRYMGEVMDHHRLARIPLNPP
jgi:hypothetical protein